MRNQTAKISIEGVQAFPQLPMIVAALKLQYKHIIICSDILPKKIVKFLKHKFDVEVYDDANCLNYDYAVEIKGVKEDQVKFEYKDGFAYVYVAKPNLAVDDVSLLKLRQVDRYVITGRVINGSSKTTNKSLSKAAKILSLDYWIKYVSRIKTDWARLYQLAMSSSALELINFINKNPSISKFWYLASNRQAQVMVVDKVQDFLNSLILVGLHNVMYNQELQLVLTGQPVLKCIPLLDAKQGLQCKDVGLSNSVNDDNQIFSSDVFETANQKLQLDYHSQNKSESNTNPAIGDVKDSSKEEGRQSIQDVTNDAVVNIKDFASQAEFTAEQEQDVHIVAQQQQNYQSPQNQQIMQLQQDVGSDKQLHTDKHLHTDQQQFQSKQDTQQGSSLQSIQPEQDEQLDIPTIDVEEWATHIQEMLDQ